MFRVTCLFLALLIPGLCLASISEVQESLSGNHTVYWSEDWESGAGLWSASNGVWEVGQPSYGTSECFDNNCAATNLDGQYPYNTNTRFESPLIDLPDSPVEVLWLGFWHWFSNSTYNGTDYGSVHLWTQDTGWVEATSQFLRKSTVWSPFYLDITEYAGKTIKIGFKFYDDHDYTNSTMGPGWYVDKIRIFDGNFPEPVQINRFDETVDLDWDGWYPSQGLWELGEPSSGITSAYSQHRCFGTVLDGNYPYDAHSRLISPYITLPPSPLDGKLFFSFKQYVSLGSYNGTDQGKLQINDGSGWVTLNTINWHSNFGSKWTERTYEISEYAGQRIRLGFYLDDDHDYDNSNTSHGWYIDDLQFSEGAMYHGNPERFENYAPNWMSSHGLWEIGTPETGPPSAYSGTRCWGTNLDGNYQYGAYDRLRTPPITLDNTTGLALRFQHWFSFGTYNGTDYGVVSIRPEGGEWTEISIHFNSQSSDWSQFTYGLDEYAGQTVQFSFLIVDVHNYDNSNMGSGWYIDDFEIFGMSQGEPPMDPFLFEVVISSGPAELSFPHILENIEKVVIYGSPNEDFIPSLGTRLTILPGTAMNWTDTDRPGWPATYYRVSIVDNLGNESVPVEAVRPITAVPGQGLTPDAGQLSIQGASPNPFNPTTFINFTLPWQSMVDVEVYDLSGRKVADLLHQKLDAGLHKVQFAPRDLASGVFFARVSAGGQVQTKKMVLLK